MERECGLRSQSSVGDAHTDSKMKCLSKSALAQVIGLFEYLFLHASPQAFEKGAWSTCLSACTFQVTLQNCVRYVKETDVDQKTWGGLMSVFRTLYIHWNQSFTDSLKMEKAFQEKSWKLLVHAYENGLFEDYQDDDHDYSHWG